MKLRFGEDAAIARWVGERLGVFDYGPCRAIGIADGDQIVAGCVYHQFRPPSIDISFASTTPRWASRGVIKELFWRYPFVQLGLKRLTAITPEENTQAQKALLQIGFAWEGRHPDALMTGAAISFGLTRERASRWDR